MIDLVAVARSLFAPGKGILAADESVHTATERLAEHGIAVGPEMRRKYRDLFIGTAGIERYISGVILFPETLAEKGNDRKLFVTSLSTRGILPGVKADLGIEPLADSPKEGITHGLLDLSERLAKYKKQKAVFTKWRAVARVEGDHLPSAIAVHENAKRLAIYAKESQAAGLVPIIESEVFYEGNQSRLQTRSALENTLRSIFAMIEECAVDRASVILKTSMALSGEESGKKDTPDEVAVDTLEALIANVPRQIAGVMFLSGGQEPDQATKNIAAIARRAKKLEAPWPISFSYARALQDEALSIWKGKEENVPAARDAFFSRLSKISAAISSSI